MNCLVAEFRLWLSRVTGASLAKLDAAPGGVVKTPSAIQHILSEADTAAREDPRAFACVVSHLQQVEDQISLIDKYGVGRKATEKVRRENAARLVGLQLSDCNKGK